MKIKKIFLMLFTLTIVATFLMTPAIAADKPIKWKAQAMWSAAELSYKTFVDLLQDFVGKYKKLLNPILKFLKVKFLEK